MNVENILALAELLESKAAEKHFNMDHYFHPGKAAAVKAVKTAGYTKALHYCGSSACIAGWECARTGLRGYQADYFGIAMGSLGLTRGQALELFTPSDGEFEMDPYDASPKEAARVLRHLAATGDVDWDILAEEPVV